MRLRLTQLAGARWADRGLAGAGAVLGIALTAAVCTALAGGGAAAPLLAAPIGASAVLVFAVPASPLAQPWPVFGGNVVSAIVGVAVAHLIGHGALAAGVAVGAAIVAMSALRCLHPPGGGSALLPVLAGAAPLSRDLWLVLSPVGINAAALVAAGWAWHRISGHGYPHRPPLPIAPPALAAADIDAALAESGETFDVSREDLEALLQRAERHARARTLGKSA